MHPILFTEPQTYERKRASKTNNNMLNGYNLIASLQFRFLGLNKYESIQFLQNVPFEEGRFCCAS